MNSVSRPSIGLGDTVRDTITGYEGIAVCVSNWLNGCQRVTIQAPELHDGKPVDNFTFDAEQLEVVTKKLVATKKPAAVGERLLGGPSIAPARAADPV